jgi:hypothetical protein
VICENCRTAASLLSEDEVIYQYLDGRPQRLLTGPEAAREAHEGCRESRRAGAGLSAVELAGSAWCDCQHAVPIPAGKAHLTLDK